MTLAASCNFVFRRKFISPGGPSIGIVPEGGYRRAENQSVKALKWLKWLSTQEKIRIQHKLNGGEQKIAGYKVDGFCAETNTAYEFYGCWLVNFTNLPSN